MSPMVWFTLVSEIAILVSPKWADILKRQWTPAELWGISINGSAVTSCLEVPFREPCYHRERRFCCIARQALRKAVHKWEPNLSETLSKSFPLMKICFSHNGRRERNLKWNDTSHQQRAHVHCRWPSSRGRDGMEAFPAAPLCANREVPHRADGDNLATQSRVSLSSLEKSLPAFNRKADVRLILMITHTWAVLMAIHWTLSVRQARSAEAPRGWRAHPKSLSQPSSPGLLT